MSLRYGRVEQPEFNINIEAFSLFIFLEENIKI